MKWLLYFFAALFAAVTVGTVIGRDPGRLTLVWSGWTVETSAVFFMAALFAVVLALYLMWKLLRSLLRFPDLIRRWRGDRRSLQAEELLARGLQRMLTGQWRTAERDFARWAEQGCDAALGYLYAARTADAQGATRRRDHYLHEAAAASRDATSLTLSRAELLPELPEARQELEHLASSDGNIALLPQVRKLQLASAMERSAWADARQLLAVLKKSDEIPLDRAQVLEWRIFAGMLAASDSEERLKAAWSELGSAARREPGLIVLYVRQRLRHGPSPDCEALLSDALSQNWDPALATLFGQIQGARPERQLRIAEGWQKRHGRDGDLLLALGRLARRAGENDQARSWLEEGLQVRPGADVCIELAQVLEQKGDVTGALKYYRQAADLSAAGKSSGI